MNKKSTVISNLVRVAVSLAGIFLLAEYSIKPINEYLIPGYTEMFNLTKGNIGFSDLKLLLMLPVTYWLVGGAVFLTLNIFKKMKNINERGFAQNLCIGFFISLVPSLFCLLVSPVIALINGWEAVTASCLVLVTSWFICNFIICILNSVFPPSHGCCGGCDHCTCGS